MEDTDLLLRRYQNHINTPGFGVPGQEALAKSGVLVIGVGSLASPVLSYLASMGFGIIGIAASGKIEQSDLPSQPLYFSSQENKLRATSAARQVREINPRVTVNTYENAITHENVLSLISEYNVIVNTSENEQECLLINDACVILRKPMVWGTLLHPLGYFAVFNFKGGATLRCMLAREPNRQLFSSQNPQGLAILSGLTGSLLANEVVKIVAEIGEVAANKLVSINHLNNTINSVSIEAISAFQQINNLNSHYKEPEQQESSPTPFRSIRPGLLALKIKYKETLQLVDIREASKRQEDIWNFLHIPASQLLQRNPEIHQDIMAILISEDGEEARRLCGVLNERYGFDNIYYLEGGFGEWVKETQSSGIIYESF